MPGTTDDVWEGLATARSIRRFTDEPVGDEVLDRCLEAATWAPNGTNVQAWRFAVLRSPEVRAVVAEAARAQGLGTCLTSWANYGGEAPLREAVGIPEGWLLAGHVVVGWPRGAHGPVRRRPLADVVFHDHWDDAEVLRTGWR